MSIFIFIVGLILGSFYNVVGLRLPKGESIISPGSHCPNCNHKLSWYENIPIISYLLLKGKCKNCKTDISIIYPLIEFLTGVLFLINYKLFSFTPEFFIGIILSSLVVIIYVSDSKYMIILDSPLIISSFLLFIVKAISSGIIDALYSIGYGLLVFITMYIIMLIGNLLFKKETLGGGDIKLSFVSGMALGPALGLFYIAFSAILAFPYAIYIIIKSKENMLPFGPFLATSMLIIYFNVESFSKIIQLLLNI